jgi:excisionase family DNA binding protein
VAVAIDTQRRALVTKQELAELLRCSPSTVDRLRRRGVIESVQLMPGGAVRFRVEDVERLLDAPPAPLPARADELEWH